MKRSITNAMKEYYSKIKDYSFFSPDYFTDIPSMVLEGYKKGNYLIKKDIEEDFDIISQKFNIEVPEIVKEYYSYWHPFIAGQHKNSPYKTEAIVLYSAINPNIIENLTEDINFWKKYNLIDMDKYFPIGTVTYVGTYVILERKTGHIFVEYGFAEDPANDKEGELYPTPLAKSLSSFICELEPYWH